MKFERRHLGPSEVEQCEMLSALGREEMDTFIQSVVPASVRISPTTAKRFEFEGMTESQGLRALRKVAAKNRVWRSYIGLGYYGTITPSVILRNILESPGWYTQYTPYQAEISQGRLEALLNFQTMVADLTGLPVANASLLDEATAAAEAMHVAYASRAREHATRFAISADCHPQTIAVVRTRAHFMGVEVVVTCTHELPHDESVFGILLQYPTTLGSVEDLKSVTGRSHAAGQTVCVASDLLALTLLTPPGEWGADIVVGTSQRFGVPLWYGGPHAAFFAVKDDLKRLMPGRLVGVSKDASGKPALRLALQTREQHIRREKATSNICTAQVLLAVTAGMFAVYHGPGGLREIASRIHGLARTLMSMLGELGLKAKYQTVFDTVCFTTDAPTQEAIKARAEKRKINLRYLEGSTLVSLDQTIEPEDFADLFWVLSGLELPDPDAVYTGALGQAPQYDGLSRSSTYLQANVFQHYRSETEFLRYVKRLEGKDLSLAFSMIPLGSCTMKLNATTEMLPISWPEFASIHPFVPSDQAQGYVQLFRELEKTLLLVTGFAKVSFQPNSGAAGEYAGLLVVRSYLESLGQGHRKICLIPKSAHGTNPASAALAGLEVVAVECDTDGNINLKDLAAKVEEHGPNVAAMMVTYPSTHGVFEETIKKATAVVHGCGGQVYMDGANLNALVGLCRPADVGADLCHINLHKTFCIPHGGGGPGAGPIAVRKHLEPFLPKHPHLTGEDDSLTVSAAPYGSAGILAIPWMYVNLMGGVGLRNATQVAILNANYVAKRLAHYFPVLYCGSNGAVAHECILDLREVERRTNIRVEDVAKRLMDFGFHAPTVSWPVPGTIMVEPTESESKAELDRFCDAMIAIHGEVREVEEGRLPSDNNPLKNAPHTAFAVTADQWNHPYSRERAAYPLPWVRERKFWPSVARIDNPFGDRNLVCTCQG